jgi:tetratricopeptide (TPR) repeat protein
VWGRIVRILLGFERIKQRGDRFFLVGDFRSAQRQYLRARAALPELDYRAPTLDALIRECEVRTGLLPAETDAGSFTEEPPSPSREVGRDLAPTPPEEPAFVPDLSDLLELAIAHKPPKRAARYREVGPDFESGYVALVQGDGALAIDRLRIAASKAPGSFVVHLELGRALGMVGDAEAARAELDKAVRLVPSDVEAMSLLAATQVQLHQYTEAEGILLPIVEQEESGAEPVFLLGQALAGQGRWSAAVERFREAVERDPGFHDAYFEAGRLLRKESDAHGALRLLIQACSMAPEEVDYNRELATLVLERDLDVATGLAACDRLMVTDEENRWEYLGWIAELYVRRGWRREAMDPLRKAVELVPPERTRERLALKKRLVELEMELT